MSNNQDEKEIELTVESLADILRQAEKAHTEHEKDNGEEEWPEFYAKFILQKFQEWHEGDK